MRLSRFTINAGLRYTGYRAGWQPGYGDSTVYSVDFVDPRIGFVWDVSGDARWAIKGHWGRYHSSMFTYLYDREASGHATIPDADSEWDPDTQTWGPWITQTPIAAPIGSLTHPYVDETIFTVEHQLNKSMALGFDFIDRQFRSIMGLVNTNNDYTAVNGIPNPIAGGTLEVWNLNTDPVYVLTTDNPGSRAYDSLVLRFEKSYAAGWQLRSSLVWTDLKGNVLKNNGYANELKDKNGLVNADGKMDYSYNEWEFKLNGSVDLPLGIVLSGQYTYLSGQYWTPYGDVRSYLDGNFSSGRNVFLEERGSEQLPARNIVDMRLAWGTKLGGTVRLDLSLEAFNLLNTGKALTVDTYYGRYRRSVWTPSSTYGVADQHREAARDPRRRPRFVLVSPERDRSRGRLRPPPFFFRRSRDVTSLAGRPSSRPSAPRWPARRRPLPRAAAPAAARTGNLVLIGGGDKPDDAMKKFVELAGGPDAPIVAIPTASSEADAADYYEKLFRETFRLHEHGLAPDQDARGRRARRLRRAGRQGARRLLRRRRPGPHHEGASRHAGRQGDRGGLRARRRRRRHLGRAPPARASS